MRNRFGQELCKYMETNSKIYLIVCDIGWGIFDGIKEKFPERIINTGMTEQATIGMSAGMAQEGLIPTVYTITPFLLERPFEAIKLDIVQQNVNVKLVSYGFYPSLGPSHAISDLEGLCKCLKLKLYKPTAIEEMLINFNEMMNETIPSFLYLSKIR